MIFKLEKSNGSAMNFTRYFLLIYFFLFIQISFGQARKIINIPNIPGFQTLKCDFHMHTVFSDGTVWPTVRVEEAWREGLDAIAISDHIEYRPHSKDVISDQNRSFEIAQPLAADLNIILIHAAEITRNMPPGHLNALFVKNANLLEREDVFDAIKEARDQGAFIFWNHPGWKAQQPDSTVWWDEHTRLLKNDQLQGIEVINGDELYPEAIEWAREKELTMLCNSDVHGPVGMSYDVENSHRPVTLVFAKSRTEGGIREALFNKRTVAYSGQTLAGTPDLLDALFLASLKINKSPVKLKNGQTRFVDITNNSDVDYELELVQPAIGFDAPEKIALKAHHVTPLELRGNSNEVAAMPVLEVFYQVKNLLVGPDENLVVTLSLANN